MCLLGAKMYTIFRSALICALRGERGSLSIAHGKINIHFIVVYRKEIMPVDSTMCRRKVSL